MMTIEEMKEIKRYTGLTNQELAELSDVPESTIQKIFSGVTRSPRRSTLQALEKSLILVTTHPYGYDTDESGSSMVAEALPGYNAEPKKRRRTLDMDHLDKQGSYTVNDLERLPDNVRAELIDGVIYNMASPSSIHQKIILYVVSQILPCVEQHEECEMLFSPIDVQLDCDNRTMIVPDLLILCDRKKDTIKNIYGAPDFIMEVLSPSTKKHDRYVKLKKYGDAGVREYWIVDPEKETVTRYDFMHDAEVGVYTFDDTVELAISDGKCEVDFREVKRHLI